MASKWSKKMPQLLSGDAGIQDLRKLVESEAFDEPTRQGSMSELDLSEEFIESVLQLIDVASLKSLKVIADTGNGMVGPILQRVYERLPVELIGLYLDPDGTLPNHGLDPLQPENRAELEARVVSENADVGFAFDGDGDRFFAIDNRGQFISGDFMTALMGQYFLEKHPGAKILYDVRASWAVPELIGAAGGVPLMERVGHAFIKARMSNEGAIFAGEVTGHYYFGDFNYADSGVIPSLIILEMLSKKGKTLSELLAPLEATYFISGEINTKVADVKAVLATLAEKYSDAEQHTMDGLSVNYLDWHFNVRGSNTEPLLRLNLEARSKELMEAKRDEVLAIIQG